MTTITPEVARRYLLGRQGLLPGRRFTGKQGAAEAIRALESVQVDPMTVVARSHDLTLWSRVDGYDPTFLNELLYRDRQFFDYGGVLGIYPMAELPYWRVHMWRRLQDDRQVTFIAENADVVASVRDEITARGPLGNRDFIGGKSVSSYRSGKVTGLALYHLWLTGDLMTHSRRGFDRLYDLRERTVPAEYGDAAEVHEAEDFFARKAIRKVGLGNLRAWANSWAYMIHRKLARTEGSDRMAGLIATGEAAAIRIDGLKDEFYLPAGDLALLEVLAAGQIPDAWRSHDATTVLEVNFLSPLDNLLDRARTKQIFGFEYIWEVYKPVDTRRWGYYTMPTLFGDRLVGRIDPRLDRKSETLEINGFWLDDDSTVDDPAFIEALARGLSRFAAFHSAQHVELEGFPGSMRNDLLKLLTL